MASELVPVEQVDRDAAADLYAVLHDVWPGYSAVHATREGYDDKREVTQAFARHRLAALEAQASRIAELEAGLPDYIEIYRIMRAAGRKRSDMARAVAEQLASVRARTLLGDREG